MPPAAETKDPNEVAPPAEPTKNDPSAAPAPPAAIVTVSVAPAVDAKIKASLNAPPPPPGTPVVVSVMLAPPAPLPITSTNTNVTLAGFVHVPEVRNSSYVGTIVKAAIACAVFSGFMAPVVLVPASASTWVIASRPSVVFAAVALARSEKLFDAISGAFTSTLICAAVAVTAVPPTFHPTRLGEIAVVPSNRSSSVSSVVLIFAPHVSSDAPTSGLTNE